MKFKKNKNKKHKFNRVNTRTKQFQKSPIPYLTDLLHEEWKKYEKVPSQWKLKD